MAKATTFDRYTRNWRNLHEDLTDIINARVLSQKYAKSGLEIPKIDRKYPPIDVNTLEIDSKYTEIGGLRKRNTLWSKRAEEFGGNHANLGGKCKIA